MSLKSRVERLEKSTGVYDLGMVAEYPLLVSKQVYDEFNEWLDSLSDD